MMKSDPYNNSYYRVRPLFEKTLLVIFGILAVFHLLFTMGIYVMGEDHYHAALKVDRYLALVGVLVAAVYVLISVTKYRRYAKSTMVACLKSVFSRENLWLALLFIWYLWACIVLSGRLGGAIFTINDRLLLDTFISFFVLYMIPWSRKTYDAFIHILMAVETVFMVWVLYNNFQLHILDVPGGQIGMTDTYCLVIACNRNTTGAFAAVFLMLALYMISTKKGLLRAAYIAAALIQLFPLYLSNSRTPYYACTAALAAAGFFWTRRKYPNKSILLPVGCGLVCGAAFFFLKYGVVGIYDGVTHLSEQLESTGIRDVSMDSNNRLAIWKACLQAAVLSFETFMVGVTPARVEGVLGYIQNIENYQLYAHNEFFQVLVAFGVPGLAIYCVWLFKTAKQCLKVAMEGRYWMLACMILMLVLSNLTESYLIAYFYFCGGVFFLVCGMVKADHAELMAAKQVKPPRGEGKGKKARKKSR